MRTLFCILLAIGVAAATNSTGFDYQLLATNRVSTMEREMNQAAGMGYRYSHVIGGETSFGGDEVVVVMVKPLAGATEPLKTYKIFSAAITSDFEKDLKRAGADGFEYKDTTTFKAGGGSREPVCIMERNAGTNRKFSYRILSTARTSTMQKELQEAGHDGFNLLGVIFSKTLLGVGEVVAILAQEG